MSTSRALSKPSGAPTSRAGVISVTPNIGRPWNPRAEWSICNAFDARVQRSEHAVHGRRDSRPGCANGVLASLEVVVVGPAQYVFSKRSGVLQRGHDDRGR